MGRHGTKPLSSRRGRYVVCYVDSTVKTSGPMLDKGQMIPREVEPPEHKQEDRASQKSWYFPLDAFDPWPEKTDICCWWCTCGFDWTPFPLPCSYDLVSNRYRTVGMFCGPSCAKSYAKYSKSLQNLDNVFRWIDRIAEDYYGYEEGSPAPLAPEKEILSKYCGDSGMSIEEYRAACVAGKSIKLLPPAWVTLKQIVQAEQDVAKLGKKVYHREDPDSIQRVQDLVRVRRIPYAGLGAKRLCDYRKKI